jgi:DNA-binding response OmpR family regulator
LFAWSDEGLLLEQLRLERAPRLLLVPPEVPPPSINDCEEDWVRSSADDRDVKARMVALAARASRHRPGPQVRADGRLIYGGQWIALSPIEHRMASVLAERFEELVESELLAKAAWPQDGPNGPALRVHLTRLRKRLLRLSLDIQNIRGRGYLMQPRIPSRPSNH